MVRRARVLVVGSGAREHAFAATFAASGHHVIVAPGNAGTHAFGRSSSAAAAGGTLRNVHVAANDLPALVALAAAERADLVFVGPELPLTLGVVDALSARGILAFGPSKAAARLEASKAFMKSFCARHRIPTASHAVFTDPDAAELHLRQHDRRGGLPLVVKADGLAAGKGVVVPHDVEGACAAVRRMMREREFGDAGRTVVLEERLVGEEASFHVVCDGALGVALLPAQDHKRLREGDEGPNTGGMGAYAPAPVVDQAVHERVMREIVQPTIEGMAKEGTPLRGVLFVGLMIDAGAPRVLEYNVRFGDPEATVLLPTYRGDWFELLSAAARGDVSKVSAPVHEGAALSIVLASEGYPENPRVGDRIGGLDAPLPPGGFVFHAGTKTAPDGSVLTAGGRVLTVGAHAATLEEAARIAYLAASGIHWPGEQHRRDIGSRALAAHADPTDHRMPTSLTKEEHG